ncbi:MAG: winged helix DNA-binding domain-containing protein [Bacteroidota bacterium]|nr:winged helix DNA-binding domain-containing protein [Bacteroidota bacterium]
MTLHDLSILRFKNQQIARSKFKTVKELARWMGAIQAQDYIMSKWAFGIRIQDPTEELVNNAIDSGEIIRTHLMRPTWHFASSDDILWILELTASQIKASLKFRDNQLGLTEPVFRKSNRIIERSLRDSNHLTREEIISELVKDRIDVGNNRASHLLVRAESDGLICSGRIKGGKLTYALLSERVPANKSLSRIEALKELASRYFTSHGPATLQDFTWWSGLSTNDSKQALEFARSELSSEIIENQTYWFAGSVVDTGPDDDTACLLPAYDEFVISYRDRTASLIPPFHKKAVSDNGIFYPTIVINGKVIGTWKRTAKKDSVVITINLFDSVKQDMKPEIIKASSGYVNFLGKKAEVIL